MCTQTIQVSRQRVNVRYGFTRKLQFNSMHDVHLYLYQLLQKIHIACLYILVLNNVQVWNKAIIENNVMNKNSVNMTSCLWGLISTLYVVGEFDRWTLNKTMKQQSDIVCPLRHEHTVVHVTTVSFLLWIDCMLDLSWILVYALID